MMAPGLRERAEGLVPVLGLLLVLVLQLAWRKNKHNVSFLAKKKRFDEQLNNLC